MVRSDTSVATLRPYEVSSRRTPYQRQFRYRTHASFWIVPVCGKASYGSAVLSSSLSVGRSVMSNVITPARLSVLWLGGAFLLELVEIKELLPVADRQNQDPLLLDTEDQTVVSVP